MNEKRVCQTETIPCTGGRKEEEQEEEEEEKEKEKEENKRRKKNRWRITRRKIGKEENITQMRRKMRKEEIHASTAAGYLSPVNIERRILKP